MQRSGLLVGLPRCQSTDGPAHVSVEKSNTVDVTGVDPTKSAKCQRVALLSSTEVRLTLPWQHP